MTLPIVCAGHPRDMGFAQGRALRENVRSEVARAGLPTRRSRWPSLRAVVSGALRGRGPGRELFRHFAHQAERLEGLAQASDLPLDSLLALQLRAGARGEVGDAVAWIVRESRPVVGFRSLELTRPWLVPAVAGVNAAGLAVTIGAPSGSVGGTGSERAESPRAAAAPAILLVQDCLARFEHLAGAIDWCRKRPVDGEHVITLADATGARACVVVSGRLRRVEPLLAGAGGSGLIVCRLGGPQGSAATTVVTLDPVGRRLRLESTGGVGVDGSSDYALASDDERSNVATAR